MSRAELEHGAMQSVEQPSPVLGRAPRFSVLGGAQVHACETRAREVSGCGHLLAPVGCGGVPARAAMPSTSSASALEKRSLGTARDPWSMWALISPTPSASITTASCSGSIPSAPATGRVRCNDDFLERAAHLFGAPGEPAAKRGVAGGVGEELEVERAPFGVAGHRVERVLGGELRLPAGCLHVVLVGVGEHVAQVLCALCAAAVEQLEEQLFLVGEVVVDRAAAEAGLFGDRVEAGGMKAAFGEHARGGGEHLLAGLLAALGLGHSLAFHPQM